MSQTNLMGKTILGYTVEERLGSGAFGTVYKVIKDNPSGHYVRALKHITIPTERQYVSVLNSMGGDVSKADNYFSEMLNNIVSEIRILNDLSEKGISNIVRYYENDIVVTDSPRRYDVFILMEYLTPLEEYIKNNDFLVSDVIKLGKDVLHGLCSCHDNGVIHRDIKDDNIFVSDNGEYKIGDFGVSKVLKDSSKAESLKGTPNFLAPEVYLGKESYTKSVDLYSLGIVLYRLLNYSRNPFLPHFPEQFYSQDEDVAFEERMTGKIPDLPSCGGVSIGNVIIKAISGKEERFQTAEKFLCALEEAENNTSKEILAEKVKIGMVSHITDKADSKSKQFAKTIGESETSALAEEVEKVEYNSSINKHLFESIGESPRSDWEYKRVVNGVREQSFSEEESHGKREPVVDTTALPMSEPEIPEALDKKIVSKVVFVLPIIILLVGIAVYAIIIPGIYGKVVSFIDWLFSSPQDIIDTVRNPNAILPKVYGIIGIRIFWYVWVAGFVVSLFFVGKRLQAKPEADAPNAIVTKKEPYMMILDVRAELELIKRKRSDKELAALVYDVKCLEEKLAIESDFGYGDNAVINCENNIARQLQFLLDTVPKVEMGNYNENLGILRSAVQKINSLLRRRIELKKH